MPGLGLRGQLLADVLGVRARRGQCGGRTGGQLAVGGEEVPQDQAERPAVVHQVVLGLEQAVVVGAERHERPAHHGRGGGVERVVVLLAPERLEGRLLVGLAPQVDGAPAQAAVGVDPLQGREAVGHQLQAEALVALQHGGQAAAQRRLVQRSAQVEGGGEVVGAAVGEELLVQPDDLLRAGELEHGRPFQSGWRVTAGAGTAEAGAAGAGVRLSRPQGCR